MAADEGRLDIRRACGGGTCADVVPPVSPDDPDLVAYWRFDEGTGFTVHDVTCVIPWCRSCFMVYSVRLAAGSNQTGLSEPGSNRKHVSIA